MSQQPTSQWLAGTTVFLVAAVWGLYWLPLREIDALGVTGLWSVLAIYLAPLICLVPVLIYRRQLIGKNLGPLLLIGGCLGIGLTCYAIGFIYTSILRTTLLFYITPVWATLLSRVLLQEQVAWNRWAAIAVGLLGVTVMLSGHSSLGGTFNIGDAAAILSGVSWAAGTVYLKRSDHLPFIDVTCMQYLAASVFVALIIWIVALTNFTGLHPPPITAWYDALPWMVGFYVVLILPTMAAIVWALQRLSPGRSGILMMSEVLVAGISAPLIAGEYLTWRDGVAAALILSAGLIEVLGESRQSHHSNTERSL